MSNRTVNYRVILFPQEGIDGYVDVTGTSLDTEGDLTIFNNGTIAAVFARGTWLYVRENK